MAIFALAGLALSASACVPAALSEADRASEAELPASLAEAYCAEGADCCKKWFGGFDADRCRRAVTDSITSYLEQSGVKGGSYVPAEGSKLLDLVRRNVRACEPSGADQRELASAMKRIVAGRTPIGQPCTDEAECADPDRGYAACLQNGSSSMCFAVRPEGRAGDPCQMALFLDDPMFAPPRPGCVSTDPDITACDGEPDLLCQCELQTCVPKGQVGDPCAIYSECASGNLCYHGDVQATCRPAGQAGAPCVFPEECALPLICVDMTCRAPVPAGGACKLQECGRDASCKRGICVPDAVAVSITECGG
jgi:hypothetical protein